MTLLKIFEQEEIYWNERSNSTWLLKGDGNTEFFHSGKWKKRKNTIYALQHENRVIEGDDNLLNHATGYYRDLFGPANKPPIDLNPSCWDEMEKVTSEENEYLVRKFTEEETKKAVFSMEKNTAPGPDHIPVEFYQECWEIIKTDVCGLFEDFYNEHLDVSRLNYGLVTLLPKLKDANKIQQYRPICLLNVKYKIFTKTLTLRLEKVMGRIIDRCQNAFIKGRNIMDGIMCLHEILHDTKRKKKDGIILKLDFEKAYDKISWDFLFGCLENRGFNQKWCKWIKEVVMKGTLSVKLNNEIGSYFQSGKGVRQGDPLSPFLFNLAADSLAKMIKIAQQNKILIGLVPEYIENGVVALQYADLSER